MGAGRLLEAVDAGVTTFDLGRPLFAGMPQSPNHTAFTHSLSRRHGDVVRSDGGSAANDVIVTGTHVGTHIDALAHVSQDGVLHGGVDALGASVGGRYLHHGVHTIPPMVCRGVVLDIPAVVGGSETCDPGYEITVADLEDAVERQQTRPRAGDVVLIRSGWGLLFDRGPAYLGLETGVPGVSEAGAEWIARHRVRAAGADTVAFERLAPGAGHATLPAHRVLLVDAGIPIIETLDLEGVAAAGAHEFVFVLAPLNIVGATGSPVRPLALVDS